MAAGFRPIRMYGEPTDLPAPDWAWVEQRLTEAPLYWIVTVSAGWPHPRPVWGVWHDEALFLSVGSQVLRRSIATDSRVTVHLESATEVVVVEGRAVDEDAVTADAAVSALVRYDEKYEYSYDVNQYGPLLGVAPATILAWTAAGYGGRDGFRSAGGWTFADE
jgi:hypothetical protein